MFFATGKNKIRSVIIMYYSCKISYCILSKRRTNFRVIRQGTDPFVVSIHFSQVTSMNYLIQQAIQSKEIRIWKKTRCVFFTSFSEFFIFLILRKSIFEQKIQHNIFLKNFADPFSLSYFSENRKGSCMNVYIQVYSPCPYLFSSIFVGVVLNH